MKMCSRTGCTLVEGHAGAHRIQENRSYDAPRESILDHDEAKSAGTITVKLALDTTEFDAALERVKAALRDLSETPVRLRVL